MYTMLIFGLIFYEVKHTGPDQADFYVNFSIIITFDTGVVDFDEIN